ncbi:uncharacterized protein LOC135394777 [Ornithodoros turicata]|uniref:uncharacterized protein LOC135394777 n=1 Tax=Ornithodoros turicata TaxID=34597 RepID=UPI00313946B1
MAHANTVSVISTRVQAEQQILMQGTQRTSVTVVSNGWQITHAITMVVRVTELRRIVNVQTVEESKNYYKTFLLLVTLLLLGVPLLMIIIGLISINTCPGLVTAPSYLVFFGVLNLLLSLSPRCCCKDSWPRCKACCTVVVASVFALLNVAGSAMMFAGTATLKVDTRDHLSQHYCSPVPYYSAPTFAAISIVLTIFFCYCACCGKRSENTRTARF